MFLQNIIAGQRIRQFVLFCKSLDTIFAEAADGDRPLGVGFVIPGDTNCIFDTGRISFFLKNLFEKLRTGSSHSAVAVKWNRSAGRINSLTQFHHFGRISKRNHTDDFNVFHLMPS